MNRLQSLRKKTGLSQTEFAKLFNMEQSRYGKYEQGKAKPDYQLLIKFADYFKVSLDYLVEREFISNQIDISQTSEKKKELFQIINNLGENHCERVIGLIYAYVDQYNQNYNKINY